MCGIVGILGREPVAGALVDALKRLEYRGYDSAGVATLENGRLARRRAEGKLRNLEERLAREPLDGIIGIGHTRWATHGRPSESNAHPHATDPPRGGSQRHHRELSRAARRAREEGSAFRLGDRYRGGRPPRHPGDGGGTLAGRGGSGGTAAAARRIRARLSVQRRGEPAHRCAQRLPVGDRLGRRRNVSRLRRHRACTLHRHGLLPRGRRLGRAHAQQRRGARCRGRQGRARGDQIAGVEPAGRQGELPPLHGQGDPRAARGGQPHARPVISTCRPSAFDWAIFRSTSAA